MIVGHQIGPEPPYGRCLAQAVLIYAAPPMCALGHTCLVIDYYILVSSLTFGKKAPNHLVFRMLLAIPWIAFGLLIYITLLLISDPSVVRRNGNHFYCFVKNQTPFVVSAVTIFVAFVAIIAVKVHTAIILRRHWSAFKMSVTSEKPYLSLSMFVRMSIFTAMSFIAAGLDMSAVYRLGDNTAGWAITLIVIPTLAALVFGTQRDILQAWVFWGKQNPDDSSTDSFRLKVDARISYRRMSAY
ncbi:hypothetical protein E4T56_gene7689 [Termitomyces sp. T112]|nr:hypothetical protein E4T56_gene7689 [Termitomyces sp. T112]